MVQAGQECLVVCVTNQQVVRSKCGHSGVFMKVNSLEYSKNILDNTQ